MNNKITIKLKIELSIQPLYCSICGQPILGNQKISLDHYIPRCHGGKDEAANLLPAHTICNSIKNDMMPDQFEVVKKDLYALNFLFINIKNNKNPACCGIFN